MTKGCAGSKRGTKALSSWLPTETGSNAAEADGLAGQMHPHIRDGKGWEGGGVWGMCALETKMK